MVIEAVANCTFKNLGDFEYACHKFIDTVVKDYVNIGCYVQRSDVASQPQ